MERDCGLAVRADLGIGTHTHDSPFAHTQVHVLSREAGSHLMSSPPPFGVKILGESIENHMYSSLLHKNKGRANI